MGTLQQDVRFGLRMLLKKPVFALIAVVALALGIGANTAIFSVVNTVLLRPLPGSNPERLILLWETAPQADRISISLPNLRDWKEQQQSFESIGALRSFNFNLTGTDQPERVLGNQVEADTFAAIGVQPLMGRTFLPDEDKPGGNPVAVLSYGLWQRRFGADPAIIGKKITLNGTSYAVIGVMPAEMTVITGSAELWVPFGQFADKLPQSRDNHPGIYAFARLKPGVTREQAHADMNNIAQRLAQTYKENAGGGIAVVSFEEELVREIRPALLILLGAVGFVLLIACANVANLLLARAATREKEIAIRTALGASRWRLVRQLLTESLILALVGGALGLLLATWGLDLLLASLPENSPVPRQNEIGLDLSVLGFTFAVSILSAIIFGLLPAFQASKADPHEALKEGGKATFSGMKSRVRSFLVVIEVALALVLLVGAGLMLKSFAQIQKVDPGFRAENLLAMQVALPQAKYTERAQWTNFYEQLLERVRPLPGVESVGVSSGLPLIGGSSESGVIVEGRPMPKNREESVGSLFQSVSPDYFRTMGITLLNGRVFTEQDRENTTPVVVIDETMAQRFFAGENPVGRRLAFEFEGQSFEDMRPMWREIIGVVRHVRYYELETQSRVELYAPIQQLAYWQRERRPAMALMIRTTSDPAQMTSAVRAQIQALDPDVPVYNVNTMENVLQIVVSQRRLSAWLLGIFAAVAMLLASVGIYGVLAYSVTQRTHEIGVRMALGAQPRDVLRMVVKQGMMLALLGIVIGLAAAFALTRLMSSLLYQVSATDPLTFSVIALLLAVVSLLACYIPARRATKVDPMTALRYE